MHNKISIMDDESGNEGIRVSSDIIPKRKELKLDPAYSPFMSNLDIFRNGGNAWFMEQMKISERLLEQDDD